MVKVVGRDERQIRRTTCNSCASILEYTRSETVRKGYSDYLGDTDYYDTIQCPSCQETIRVDVSRRF